MTFRKQILSGILIVLLTSIILEPANAQFIQQGPKLEGPGGFGNSVALSADGNTAIIGVPGDGNGVGAAWVYVRNNGVWTQAVKLVGTGAVGQAGQGSAVDLSADGNTAIVGGKDDGNGCGAAWVFTRNGGVWSQQGPKLVGAGSDGSSHQGASVALSGDGNTAIVGGQIEAWVFIRSGGIWNQQGPKLALAWAGYYCPTSVALSSDGNTAIFGGQELMSPGNWQGFAYVFIRRNGLWRQQGPRLEGEKRFGWASSVDISADGNTAILSAAKDDQLTGVAVVYFRSNEVWRRQGRTLIGFRDNYADVSLSSDGNTALVGSFYETTAGVFTRTNGVWSEQSSVLVGTGSGGMTWPYPVSVAISGDGKTAIVGWPNWGNNPGAAWVFAIPQSGAGPFPAWSRVPVPVGVAGGVSRDGIDRNLEAVAYGTFQTNASMFVIGGRGGNIITYDGNQVVNRVVAAVGLNGVAFSNNGVAVAVADGGWILRSTNGVQWTGQQKTANSFGGVAYGNGVFVAVQAGGRIFRSTDFGQTWQESLNAGQPWTTQDLTGAAYGDGTFVVTGKASFVLTSTDAGVSWSVRDLKQPLMWLQHYSGYPHGYDDPNAWQPANPATDLTGVAFGHGHFVATGANGVVFVSQGWDWFWTKTESGLWNWQYGLTWSWTFVDPAGSSLPLHGVGYGSGSNQEYFVAVGKDGVTLIGTVDLATGVIAWTRAGFPSAYLRGVAYGMGRFVAVGYGATIAQSKLLPW